MKTIKATSATGIVLIAFGQVLTSVAGAQAAPQCDVRVTGTGADPADAAAVSIAVNGPHVTAQVTVCLEGVFDFGTTGFVAIDPQPSGFVQQLDITGLNGATIVGGLQPLRFPDVSTLPRLSITNLRFEDPFFTAISIFRGNERIEISGNEIAGVQSLFVPALNATLREGIAVTSALAEVAGVVEITDNIVDGGTYDPVSDLTTVNAGIGVFGQFAINPNPISASVLVEDNDVANWSGSAIWGISLDGATIANNSIAPGVFGNRIGAGACALANGLGAATAISLVGTQNSTIRSNDIRLEGAEDGDGLIVCNAGIMLLGNNGVNTPNSVGNTVVGNRIRGTGTYALIVGLDTSAAETGNRFLGNNASTFLAIESTLFLGTGANDNQLIGHFDTIEGNAAGNTIRGR